MRISASQSRVVSILLGALLMRKQIFDGHHLQESDDYITDDLPPIGMKVEVIGYVGASRHLIPFLCCWTEEGWVIAGSKRPLAFNVAGWRRAGV